MPCREAFLTSDTVGRDTLDGEGCVTFLQQLVPELSKEHVEAIADYLEEVVGPEVSVEVWEVWG